MNGYGDFIWKSGKSYSGFYKKDLKEGLGLFYWKAQSEVYFGFWLNGQRDGPAIQISNNTKFYSFWEQGKQIKLFDSKEDAYAYVFNRPQKFKRFFSIDLDPILKNVADRRQYSNI